MDEPNLDSLERFVETRGMQWLGHNDYRRSSATQIGIGGFLTLLGFMFLFAGLIGGAGAAFGAIGPLIGGILNLIVGFSMRRRFANEKDQPVILSPEAKGLLIGLIRQFTGWRSPWGNFGTFAPQDTPFGQRRASRRARSAAMWGGYLHQIPFDLEPTELAGLEVVAREYNRISGSLAASAPNSATLSKLGPRIQRAADETMANALHQTSLLAKFPEGGDAPRAHLEAHAASLSELAERVRTIAAEAPSLTDRVVYRSSIDDVLDELRLEQTSRSELKLEEPKEQNVENRS